MSILRAFPSAGHTHTSEICQVSRGAQVRRPVIFQVAHVSAVQTLANQDSQVAPSRIVCSCLSCTEPENEVG